MSRDSKKDPWLPARLDNLVQVRAVEAEIEKAARSMLRAWLPVARAAVVGRWQTLTASGQVPPPNPDDVARADQALNAAIQTKLMPVLADAFGKRFAQVCRDAIISDQRYREAYAAKTTLRIQRISHTTRETIRELVAEGVADGLSMQAVAKGVEAALTLDGPAPRFTMFAEAAREEHDQAGQLLRRLYSVPLADRDAKWREQLDEIRALRNKARQDRDKATAAAADHSPDRALRIARTEVMTALNGGTLAGMRARAAAFGEPMEKQWLSTPDARCRASHAAADGQRVALDQPFTVGDAKLDHPGDPDAPADEIVNCRCCMLEVRPGEDDPRNPATGRTLPGLGDPVRAAGTPAPAVGTITSDPRGGAVTASTTRKPRARITEFTAPAPAAAPAADAAAGLSPFTAVLAVEGSPTGDGRQFTAGALTWRQLPLPLMFQPQTGEWGHSGSYPVGRIDTITRDGNLIRATGFILPPNPADPDDPIQALLTLLENGVRVGPSVDLDDMVIEFPDVEIAGEDDFAGDPADDVMQVTAGRIIAATVVATPAFAEVAIQLGTDPAAPAEATDPTATSPDAGPTGAAPATPNDGPAGAAAARGAQFDAAAPTGDAPAGDGSGDAADGPQAVERADGTPVAVGDSVLAIVGEGDQARPVEATVTAVDPSSNQVTLDLGDGNTEVVPVDSCWPDPDAPSDQEDDSSGEPAAPIMASVASAPVLLAAGPPAAPRSWFNNPEFGDSPATDPRLAEVMEFNPRTRRVEGTGRYGAPLFVADDGRVFGHIATWGTCHTGFADTCVTPPQSQTDYAYFNTSDYVTAEGDRVQVGRLTVGGGHADPRAGFRAALEHYDNVGTVAAFVVAGEDAHGIWVAGTLAPGLSNEQEVAFRSCPPSGDWRRIRGSLELMAVCSVNVPGFPVPRRRLASVGGVQASLVAAGVLNPARMSRPRADKLTTAQVADEVRAVLGRRRQADQLARSIGRDPRARMAALAASVKGAE